jgi:methylphosphotriester-DNA--protein-cysteine methyltransferase
MDADKYARSVTLMCPTCGHKDFERADDNSPLRCTSCDRVFTREELIRENGEVIEAEVEELKTEVLRDAKKEQHETLRKAFKGSKHIRFK